MTTANHVLVGSLIAVSLQQPALVLPAAFASHFVLDALPHYGYDGGGYGEAFKHRTTVFMEILGGIGLILILASGVFATSLALVAALFAVLPDFEWPYRYFFYERKGLTPPKTFLTDFHKKVQWCERKWGILPELITFLVGYVVLLNILS